MIVTKLFLIGNLTVPSTWIALIIAFIHSYSSIRLKFGKLHADRFGDAIFYLILIWKLSVILTDFKIVITVPWAILYFNGGFTGFILGLVFVAARTWLDWKKDRIEKNGLVALFVGTVSVQAVFQLMMVVLNEGSLFASIGTSVLFLGLLFFIWKDVQVSESHLTQLSLLFMAVHLFVATIQPKGLMNPPLFVTFLLGLFFIGIIMKKPLFKRIDGGNPIE